MKSIFNILDAFRTEGVMPYTGANFVYRLGIIGLILSSSGCDKDMPENGDGSLDPKPTEIHTYDQISTTINVLSADAKAKTVAITNIPDEKGTTRSITYKLTEDNSASNRVKLMFVNAGLSKISSSSAGGFLGTFSTPDDLQVMVKRAFSNITASSNDGKENAKIIRDTKAYGKIGFSNFANEEAVTEFMRQLKDTTNTSWVPVKADFKYGGKDWSIK